MSSVYISVGEKLEFENPVPTVRLAVKSINFKNEIPKYLKMIQISGGTFRMGSARGLPIERPTHQVTVNSFEIASTEITQKFYKEVMEENPSLFKNEYFPVLNVSWYDALVFCNQLSIYEGLTPCYSVDGKTNPSEWGYKPHENGYLTGKIECDFSAEGYRLPTEAEWEYAALGGAEPDQFYFGGTNNLDSVGWFGGNSKSDSGAALPHEVALKNANGYGLYDMNGNVSEWCWDIYGKYSKTAQTNPLGAKEGGNKKKDKPDKRVHRGGSFGLIETLCSNTSRAEKDPHFTDSKRGFRIVRTVQ